MEIVKVVNQTRPGEKGMIIEVTDERLLRETGGIIQGMSGSPIVQNGMLVGPSPTCLLIIQQKDMAVLLSGWCTKQDWRQSQKFRETISLLGKVLHIEKDVKERVLSISS